MSHKRIKAARPPKPRPVLRHVYIGGSHLYVPRSMPDSYIKANLGSLLPTVLRSIPPRPILERWARMGMFFNWRQVDNAAQMT